MFDSAKYQMDFVNKIAFNRFGGTKDEEKAAELILGELSTIGGKGEIEEFSIAGYSIERASLEVTEPFYRKINVTGIGRTGSTDGIIEAELYYAEAGLEENFEGAEGKIVLINSTAPQSYERLMKSGALGFLVYSGAYQDDVEKTDLDQRMLRPQLTDKYGKLPGLCMRTADAISLLKDGAAKVRMELSGKDEEHISRNVVAFIEGSEKPEKELLFTAHYDSTIFGLGSWDNASGSANILELYRYYLENPPKYSMRFIWCGSEEQGLLGSKAYVEAHAEQLDKIMLCLNFDMTGVIVGSHRLMITGNDELHHYVKALSRESGFITRVVDDVHHSDSSPFADKGVPAVGFMRDGQGGGHSRFDIPWPLSGEQLDAATDFAKILVNRIDNAKSLPFKREIAPAMAEMVAKYIHPENG